MTSYYYSCLFLVDLHMQYHLHLIQFPPSLRFKKLAMPPQPAWFREVFGFQEKSSFNANREMFRMEGDVLVTETAPAATKRMRVGPFSTPSLGELRAEIAAAASEPAQSGGGLTFRHLADPTGVSALISAPENDGVVFQAASQFNALEM